MILRTDRARAAQVFPGKLPEGWQQWIENGGPIEVFLERLAAEFANHREAAIKGVSRG